MDCVAQTLLFAIDGILSLVDSLVAIEPSIMIGSGIFRCSLNMVFGWSKTEQVDAATYLAYIVGYNRNFKSSWLSFQQTGPRCMVSAGPLYTAIGSPLVNIRL